MTPVSPTRRLHQMVEAGHLARLASPNIESAGVLFEDFGNHRRGVAAVLEVGDYAGTLLLAYEAARKVAQALLLAHGYRVPNVEGAHKYTFEAVGWLVSGAGRDAVRNAQYLRMERNENMYREARVSAENAQEARQVVDDLAEHVVPPLSALLGL